MATPSMLAGRYRLGDLLGKGGMGEVWRALDTVLRREVAVKTVDLGAAEDVATRERFEREALATASLSHPNVVTVFDAGIDGDTAYLVMELLPGPTLSALIADRGQLSIADAVDYARQAATAMEAAHLVGVIHRDIKPGNLMFDALGRIKVVDFGIARLAQTSAARLTATDATLGSASYMAPEQVRGEQATEATDVYALGCVLTTLLTGKPPFGADHPMAVMHQQLHATPPHLRDRRPDVPAELDSLSYAMLAKDPSDRPRDLSSALAALVGLAAGADGGIDTVALTRPSSPAMLSDQATLPSTRSGAVARHPHRHLRWLLVGASVGIAGLVWLVLAVTGNDDPTGTPERGADGPRASAPPATLSEAPPAPASTSAGDPEQLPPAESLTAAIGELRDAVVSAATSGAGGHEADKLLKDLDKLDDSAASGDTERLARDLDHFEKSLEHAVDKGAVDSVGQAAVQSAIAAVRDVLG